MKLWTFDTDDVRVFTQDENGVAFYGRLNDKAWLACEDAPHLRDWR